MGETLAPKASAPAPTTGLGFPPEAETRHRLGRPPRAEENTISRPSGVQVGPPSIQVLSMVSRSGAPPVAGMTYRSDTTPATIARMKATLEPSGEKAGAKSSSWPEGDVSRRTE